MIDLSKDLVTRGNYKQKYLEDFDDFLQKIISKKCVPEQLEIQPGREKGEALCWMNCPYCYGGSAKNTSKKLPKEKYLELLDDITNGPNGGIAKVIFAGYATDPLNYEHIDDLLFKSFQNNLITGVHTKLLRYSKKFTEIIANNNIEKSSYLTVSIDAGFPESYNKTHGVKTTVNILNRIYKNIENVAKHKDKKLDLTSTYLLTTHNSSKAEIMQSIKDIINLGLQTHRFSFPQIPRGYNLKGDDDLIIKERAKIYEEVNEIIYKTNNSKSVIITIVDPEKELGIENDRYLPCFARFVHPAIGYDGYLYHCSESSSPDFHSMMLGDLQSKSFWDLYYSYNGKKIVEDFRKMEKLKCLCSRNLYATNKGFQNSELKDKLFNMQD